jgi:hypothetical protein
MSAPKTPIGSAGEAEREIAGLHAIMQRLGEALQTETAHLRAGRLREAVALEAEKQELAHTYAAAAARIKAAGPLIARALPHLVEPLRRRHTELQELLRLNMTVLATAHAVSEGIIRGVSGELAKSRTPSTYGATGRANAPNPRAGQPLAVSRTL